MIGELTASGSGANVTYDLPLVRTFQPLAEIRPPAGATYPSVILATWTKEELKAVGLARVDEVGLPDGQFEVATGFEDAWGDTGVTRTYTIVARDPEEVRPGVLKRVTGMRDTMLDADLVTTIPAGVLVIAADKSGSAALSAPEDFVIQRDPVSLASIQRALNGVAFNILPNNADGSPNTEGTGTHIAWRMRDNRWVVLTGAQFRDLVATPDGLHWASCFDAAWAHKQAIDAADTATLRTYDLSSGWPPIAPAD